MDVKLVATRVLEEPWTGNLDVIDQLVSSGYVGHDPGEPEPVVGPESERTRIERLVMAFPDGRLSVDEQIVDGATVATRWSARGRHLGELAGIAATGREVTVTGVTFSRIEDGKVVEQWTSWDRLGLLVQLGAVTEPAHA